MPNKKQSKSAAEKKAELVELIREVIREDRREDVSRKFSYMYSSAAAHARDSLDWSMRLRKGLEYSYKPLEAMEVNRLIDPVSGYYYYKSTDGKETVYESNEKASIFQRLMAFLK